MKQAAIPPLRLYPHPCPLCGLRDENKDQLLYPARLTTSTFSEAVFSARRSPDKLHYRLVRCQHDGLVRSDPVAASGDLEKLYARSHFTYDQEVELLKQTYIKAMQPTLSLLTADSKIVEVGCGNGFMLAALQQMGFTNVWGVEPSKEAVSKAPKSINSKIIQKPFSPDLFKVNSLDAVVLFQTLDHIPNVDSFIESCYRALKPGGYLMSFHHDVSAWLVSVLGEAHPIIDVEHTQLFDGHTSKALFTKHGFLIKELEKQSNLISLQHLVTLLPLPTFIKKFVTQSESRLISPLLRAAFEIKLGNIWITGQKPESLTRIVSTPPLTSHQKKLRQLIVRWSYELGLSHLGSCLSCVDIISAIYSVKRTQDDFILSSGHAAFGWYAVLVDEGLLTAKVVKQLSVHPDRKIENGISVSSGSLGQGLPIAVGKALANRKQQVYCLTSDGEWSEGSMIEGLRVAIAQDLKNLTIIVNCNGWGAYRETPLEKLKAELEAFDVLIEEVAGHDPVALKEVFAQAKRQSKVTIVLAKTSVEQLPSLRGQDAHYQVLSKETYQAALAALK